MVDFHGLERIGAVAWSVFATYSVHAFATVVLAYGVTRLLPRGKVALACEIWRAAVVIPLVTTATVLLFATRPSESAYESEPKATSSYEELAEPMPSASAILLVDKSHFGAGFAAASLEVSSVAEEPAALVLKTAASPANHDWRWLCGLLFLVLSGIGAASWARGRLEIRRVLTRSSIASDVQLRSELAELCRAAGVTWPVSLRVSRDVASPLALGQEHVILPADLANSATTREVVRASMAHELAHLMRGDPHWYAVAHLAFHVSRWLPTQQLLITGMHRCMEQLCDDHAARLLGSGLQIAKSLEWVAQRTSLPCHHQEVPAMIPTTKSLLVRRVHHLLSQQAGHLAARGGAATWMWGGAIAITVTMLCPTFATPAVAHELETTAVPDRVVAAPPSLASGQDAIASLPSLDAETSTPTSGAQKPATVQTQPSDAATQKTRRAKNREERQQQRTAARVRREEMREAKHRVVHVPPVHPAHPAPAAPPSAGQVVVPPAPPAPPAVALQLQGGEGIHVVIDAETAKLTAEINRLSAELSRDVAAFGAEQATVMAQLGAELGEHAGELAKLQIQLATQSVHPLSEAEVSSLEAKIAAQESKLAQVEKRLEAKAQEVEAKMALQSKDLEARLSATAAKLEAKVKEQAEKLGKRAAPPTK